MQPVARCQSTARCMTRRWRASADGPPPLGLLPGALRAWPSMIGSRRASDRLPLGRFRPGASRPPSADNTWIARTSLSSGAPSAHARNPLSQEPPANSRRITLGALTSIYHNARGGSCRRRDRSSPTPGSGSWDNATIRGEHHGSLGRSRRVPRDGRFQSRLQCGRRRSQGARSAMRSPSAGSRLATCDARHPKEKG